ncbi:hypothetical protein BFP97_11610 [Roseivirga sp. 4D4]|uniref:hypothetical protein n=1 Tax=Roseivirga sp. 4D4 TaxID=1889784 RepID=UPI000853228B|nr:hypothetical protein [Roseivirga sp. 4D4]OEK02129.1 hypothetical protein BFP97_11610 [Roseivirga sp. 4D4]
MKRHTFYLCFLLTCVYACSPISNLRNDSNQRADIKDEILFLTLEATKSDDSISFKILNQKLVDGKIKRPMPSELSLSEFFKVSFNDRKGNSLLEVAIENPLNKVVEVPSENGTFSRQQVELDKSSVVLRVNYSSRMDNISISHNTNELITTLKLDEQ